ncbi:hypothetical protein F4775DRAFT_132511 [Biscogniauxia sp. FL1348]|nr:hypothetical protein F4775DRAFT_132511 [Biscogniauxia sp. FL1348]
MEDTAHYQTPNESQPWSTRFAFLLASVLCAILLHKLIRYLFRLATIPKTSSSQSTNELGLSEEAELESCYEENRKLTEIWQIPDKSSVVFVAIGVQTKEKSQNDIVGIGLSMWCLDNGRNALSYYWETQQEDYQVRQPLKNDQVDFLYGQTIFVKQSDIAALLAEFFGGLSRYSTICIIMHGIEEINTLKKYWSFPTGVVMLDTQKIWQAQHKEVKKCSLEHCIRQFSVYQHLIPSLENRGNNAQAVMKLLQNQGPQSLYC